MGLDMGTWSGSKARLTEVMVLPTGTMEDVEEMNLIADFANCKIGGGVLGFS